MYYHVYVSLLFINLFLLFTFSNIFYFASFRKPD